MKRVLTALMLLAALFVLMAPASADILWEPENLFARSHGCEKHERYYYANGQEGFVTSWRAPNGFGAVAQYENGQKLYVHLTYGDWGLVTSGGDEGWVPLGDLAEIYDREVFAREHADRIAPYHGELANYDGEPVALTLYEYPGAAELKFKWYFQGNTAALEQFTGSDEVESCIQSVFVDENGLTWGYAEWMEDGWFCLDSIGGEGFPIREVAEPELIPARTPTMPLRVYIPVVAVAAVAAVTLLLLRKYRKKK